jgi:hypothetical protein
MSLDLRSTIDILLFSSQDFDENIFFVKDVLLYYPISENEKKIKLLVVAKIFALTALVSMKLILKVTYNICVSYVEYRSVGENSWLSDRP